VSAAKVVVWFLVLLFSMHLVFEVVGLRRMVQFFPEGRRWWMLPAQLVSLAIFAAVVLNHPF
jgi:drug/metabolite transporter superfamily protein YnfA